MISRLLFPLIGKSVSSGFLLIAQHVGFLQVVQTLLEVVDKGLCQSAGQIRRLWILRLVDRVLVQRLVL